MPAGPGLCPDRPGLFPGQWVFTQRMHSSVTRRKCIFVTIGKRGKPRFCGAGMAPRVPLALAANKSESEPSPQVPRNALGRFYRTARRFKLRLRRKLRNSNRTEISENPKFIYENLRIFMRAISGTSPRLPCAFVPGPLPMGHENLLAQLLFLGMFCALKSDRKNAKRNLFMRRSSFEPRSDE